MDNLRNCSCPHQGGAAHLLAWPPHHWWFLLPVHQSPVSSLQPLCHDLQPEPADGTCLSTYCPDYTVRALSDLQFIKVTQLQYLNALLATQAQNLPQTPEDTGLQVV